MNSHTSVRSGDITQAYDIFQHLDLSKSDLFNSSLMKERQQNIHLMNYQFYCSQ